MDAAENSQVRVALRHALTRLTDPLNEAIAVELGAAEFALAVAESAREAYASVAQLLDELTT